MKHLKSMKKNIFDSKFKGKDLGSRTGCLWIVLVIGILSVFGVEKTFAAWQRFILAEERIDINGHSAKELRVVHDLLNNVDCYVVDGRYYQSGVGIFCMKAEK